MPGAAGLRIAPLLPLLLETFHCSNHSAALPLFPLCGSGNTGLPRGSLVSLLDDLPLDDTTGSIIELHRYRGTSK